MATVAITSVSAEDSAGDVLANATCDELGIGENDDLELDVEKAESASQEGSAIETIESSPQEVDGDVLEATDDGTFTALQNKINGASAGDANDTAISSEDTNDLIEMGEGISPANDLKNDMENEVLSASPKTFFELNKTINGNENEIQLESNYTYDLITDGDFKDGIAINKDITIDGNGYTVDGDNACRLFSIGNNCQVTFKNLFFINAYARGYGGAISVSMSGECICINCTFKDNVATNDGGGMYHGTAINSTFINNHAAEGGAARELDAVNCTFINNTAQFGGAIYHGDLVNCSLIDNYADNDGGAMCDGSAVNCSFTNNRASRDGGALRRVTATNCTFFNNTATNAGAAFQSNVFDSQFIENTATENGGALYGAGYSATNCTFKSNKALNGGATYMVTAIDSTFVANTAISGGAMYGGNAAMSIFKSNTATNGGAAYNVNSANCLFENNSATENGGAIYESKSRNSTFDNNRAGGYGGAACNSRLSTDSVVYGNNVDSQGNEVHNVTYFTVGQSKNFTALNELINGDGSVIVLDSNYTYDLITDGDFKDGIAINKDITIDGNGYTVDGDNACRLFSIGNNCQVTFKNLFFINAYARGYGGAISVSMSGECICINCTFKDNVATNDGGGMYHGTAINSTFINNHAAEGGAARELDAVNCTFINNTAQFGGAIYHGDLVNCSLIDNYADNDGGAMCDGSAVNCSFTNNRASRDGGALRRVTATNCTFFNNTATNAGAAFQSNVFDSQFIENTATENGGALYGAGYSATNCTFKSNKALNGGATYLITATDCTFKSNRATVGEAMYKGTATNCIFVDNDYYDIIIAMTTLTASNFTSYYNSGDKLIFDFKTLSGAPINNANITIRIYKNNALVGTYYALSGDGWTVNLDVGSYIAVCSVENQAYDVNATNATLTITKAITKVTAPKVTTAYNGNKYLVVTLRDSQGRPISNVYVTISLNWFKTLKTDKKGQVKLSTNNLAPNTYSVKITFNGNSNYLKSTTTTNVVVKKATPKLTAKKKTFKRNVKTKKYKVTLKTNRNKAMKNVKLALKIKKKTYWAKTNKKGVATFKITKLKKKGKYNAVIKYGGDKYYNKVTKTVRIIVKK